MNSTAQKSTEQFTDSQDSLTNLNPDHPVHNEAYHASKTQNVADQVKRSFASAKDTILSAKDQVHDHFVRAPTHPEMAAALPQSEIEKDSIDQEAVKEKLEEMIPLGLLPGPGRYHPQPENFENIGFPTKVGDKMKAGLESVKGSLVAAKAAIRTSKEAIFGVPVEPIEGGMPGRNHPHPERFYHYIGTPALPSKMSRVLASAQTSLQADVVSTKTALLSAKNKVFGSRIHPIEGGMPGRNHPHAERFYAPAPTLMDKVKTGLNSVEVSAQNGLLSAKNAVFGEKIVPIEGGMPGRNHPHAERFYAPTPTCMDRVTTGWTSVGVSAQHGLASAQTGLLSAKDAVFGEKVVPIEGGMPGRNHPHEEDFYAPAPTLMDRVKTGLNSVEVSAQTGLLSAKNAVFGEKIVPIEGGMPGRNHPHAERFYAPTPTFMDRVKTGWTSVEVSAQHGLASAQTGLLSAKNAVFGEKVVPIEGGMPGRNHPHEEDFYAPAPTLMDRVKTGMTSAGTGLTSAKNTVFGEKIVPIEGGMPGRNHPHPERFEVGFFTGIKEKLFPERSGDYEHKIEAHAVELETYSEIDTASIDQIATARELEPTLTKETIHPLQGMPGPGRNHPLGDSLKAQDESLLTKLADTWKHSVS